MNNHPLIALFVVGLSFLIGLPADAQVIQLNNPSFEGTPGGGVIPPGWLDCGFPGETPPDTHPSGAFQVYKSSYDGYTYLGMVTRGNDTWEAVAQPLTTPLKQGTCYNFSMYLSRSESYVSASNWSKTIDNYTDPIVVRIWAGNGRCDKKERLAELGPVNHSDWRVYETKLNPRRDYNFLIIEVYYKTPTLMPYNGNILIDKVSPIVPCDEEYIEEPIVKVDEQDNVNVSPKKPKTPPTEVKDPPKPPKPSVEENVFIPELKEKSKLSEGQIIRLENVNFVADSSTVEGLSAKVLDELSTFLKKNREVNLEIGGHTNSYPPKDYCDRLSTSRANAVRSYLISKGVSSNRLTAVGYGKEQPIADNSTLEGRRRNQRVEIKILNIK
ncbi:MAG: OmpA family protein [Bacteroidota bacterium]